MGSFIGTSPPGCDPATDPGCVDTWPGGTDGGPIDYPPIFVPVAVPTISGLDDVVSKLIDVMSGVGAIVTKILSALASLLTGILALWKLVSGVLGKIASLIKAVKDRFDKILKPVLDALKRQRQALLDIYNKFFRPIIQFIEGVRRVLRILEIFHVGFARRLDARLAQLEGIILKPFLRVFQRVNTLGGWLNYILTIDGLLHRGLLLGSIAKDRATTFNLLASAPTAQPDPGPQITTSGAVTFTGNPLLATQTAFAEITGRVDDPIGALRDCAAASFHRPDITDDVNELWRCLRASVHQ